MALKSAEMGLSETATPLYPNRKHAAVEMKIVMALQTKAAHAQPDAAFAKEMVLFNPTDAAMQSQEAPVLKFAMVQMITVTAKPMKLFLNKANHVRLAQAHANATAKLYASRL